MSPGGRDRYAERAAVLTHFRAEWIDPSPGAGDADDLTAFLWDECERVQAGGRPYWRLRDPARAAVFHTVPRARLRAALEDLPGSWPHDLGPVQPLLERFLYDVPIVADDLGRDELAGLVQLDRWLGPHPDLPPAATVERLLDRRSLTDPLHRLLDGAFAGRDDVMGALADHVRGPDRGTFVLRGIGGSGKSTILAELLVGGGHRDGDLFGYVNYDRSWLIDTGTVGLFDELVRQLALQLADPAALGRLGTIRDEAAHLLANRFSAGDASSGGVQSLVDVPDGLLAELGAVLPAGRPWIVALDTYEEIQRRDLSDSFVLTALLDRLRRVAPGLRAVIAGRAPVLDIQGTTWVLGDLSAAAAGEVLRTLTHRELATPTVNEIIAMVGGNPLAVRLAAAALNQSREDDPVGLLRIVEGNVQGQLYGRILDHIDDDDVRRLAHPGLVLRRITPEVIREVLAVPCELGPVDEQRSWDLYRGLQREATLMTPSTEEPALVERSDVRAVMLPALTRSDRDKVDAIHRAAITYYAGQPGTIARREELYHRLMLGQDRAEIDARWDPVAGRQLLSALDELPAAAQAYLAAKLLSVRLDPVVRRTVDDDEWKAGVSTQAARKIANRELDEALALVRERRGADGEPLLPELEIEALERGGHLAEALALAREARVAPAHRGSPAMVERLTLHETRLLERQRAFAEAFHLIDGLADATAPRRERRPGIDDLVVLSTWLRLARRLDLPAEAREAHLTGVAAIAETVPLVELRSRPSLLRDLAAEAGYRSPLIAKEADRLIMAQPAPPEEAGATAEATGSAELYQQLSDEALGLAGD